MTNNEGNNSQDLNGDNGSAGDDGADELDTRISKIANAAQSSHATRMQRQFDKKLAEVTSTLTSQIAELKEALAASSQRKGEDSDDKNDVGKIQEHYERKFQKLQQEVQEERKAREQEHSLRRTSEERSALSDALRAGGVDGPLLKSALALLYTEEKRVIRTEDGEIAFRLNKDGFEEEVSLSEGIAEWLASAEGKHYIPARNVSGSGATGPSPSQKKGGKRTKEDAARELEEALFGNLL